MEKLHTNRATSGQIWLIYKEALDERSVRLGVSKDAQCRNQKTVTDIAF